MSTRRRHNPFLNINNDTGFGTKKDSTGGRFLNKDGTYNIKRVGVSNVRRISIYQTLLDMSRIRFLFTILFFYLSVNVLYTLVYLFFGINDFQGFVAANEWGKIKELFYFSTETFTTVGYGRINPVGDGVNIVAAIEAWSGFLSFAIATGLMYGRFSKAKAHTVFSEHALIAPYRDGTALMFRMASYKDKHILHNAKVQVNVGMLVQEQGKAPEYKYYVLPLERDKVESFMMNWTVVHPIDDNSPLQGLNADDMRVADIELYITVQGFDNIYSNAVLKRTSYTYNEIVHNAKFKPMYRESEDGTSTILEMDKLGAYTFV